MSEIPRPQSLARIPYDAARIATPDAAVLDVLVRMQLEARRRGTSIELHNVSDRLCALIELCGLAEELGLQPCRQTEHREQAGVDEEVEGRDASP